MHLPRDFLKLIFLVNINMKNKITPDYEFKKKIQCLNFKRSRGMSIFGLTFVEENNIFFYFLQLVFTFYL